MAEFYRLKSLNLISVLLMILIYPLCAKSPHQQAQDNNQLNDIHYKTQVLKKVDSLLAAKYVLSEKAEDFAEEFIRMCADGIYRSITDPKIFAEQVTKDLIQITGDKHFSFRVIEASDSGEKSEGSLRHPIRYHKLGINENKGFAKFEWIEGNIAYLDLRRFYYFSDVKDYIVTIMKFFSTANAVIIDLRENGGGSGDYLSSYFLNYPTQLNGWYSREDDTLTEYWTSNDIGIEPLTEVPLFLVTSKRTFSASESFAYDMKVKKRAVIVGDSTKGGAHSVDLYRIDDQFEIYIPTVRAINPVTGTNWEGTGVIPDIIVPSEIALDTTLALARKAGEAFAREKEKPLKSAVEQMQDYIDRAEDLFQDHKNEEAVTALNSFFQIADDHDLVNEFFVDVLAYNYLSEGNEEILYAILKKKIEFFPNSATAYESLARAYYRNNKYDLAITYYELVLKLEPDNRNARKILKELQSAQN